MIRFGVIGAGGIALKKTIPGLLKAEGATLTAIMNTTEETAGKTLEALRKSFPEHKETLDKVKIFTSAEALMESPLIDAVYIASPVYAHLAQALCCAEHEKHVLMEKPLGLCAEEAKEMAEELRKSGVKAQAALMMRFNIVHRWLKRLIEEGKLGKIVSARAQQIFWYPPSEKAWRQKKELGGGGALMDVGVHGIDLLEFILGSPVISAQGLAETRVFSYPVDDIYQLLLRFENGAVAYLDGSFCEYGAPKGSFLEVYGTEGTVIVRGSIGTEDGGELEGFLIQDGERKSLPDILEEPGDLYTKEIEAFVRSIETGEGEEVPVEEAVHVQQVIDGIYGP